MDKSASGIRRGCLYLVFLGPLMLLFTCAVVWPTGTFWVTADNGAVIVAAGSTRYFLSWSQALFWVCVVGIFALLSVASAAYLWMPHIRRFGH